MVEDFETAAAIEEAAQALCNDSAIAMNALGRGETYAATRRRLLRFVAGAPPTSEQSQSGAGPSRGASSSGPGLPVAASLPHFRRPIPADARTPIVVHIRRPTS